MKIIQKLYMAIVACIRISDTANAIYLLDESKSLFKDPLCGDKMHAQLVHCAIQHMNKQVLHYLFRIKKISDILFYEYCGQTPIEFAMEQGAPDFLPLLYANTDKNFALHVAVKFHKNTVIDELLHHCTFKEKFLKYLGLK